MPCLATNFSVLTNLQPHTSYIWLENRQKLANSSQSPDVKFYAEISQNSPITKQIGWKTTKKLAKFVDSVESCFPKFSAKFDKQTFKFSWKMVKFSWKIAKTVKAPYLFRPFSWLRLFQFHVRQTIFLMKLSKCTQENSVSSF